MTESTAEQLEKAQGLLASLGDISGLLRHLRACSETLPLGEVARLVAGAARLAGFDDLAQAAAAVAASRGRLRRPGRAGAVHFGYACIEHGRGYLAVRPLAAPWSWSPDSPPGAQRARRRPGARPAACARPSRCSRSTSP